ncbi:CidA/LrgA family protein [Ornithinibacillus halotolerans]|uniref:Membrane protein n=1 Tax=Ornithinibacillus halotolerans TaxID=1274357 RepID=A0A916S0G4_9BACI|nr:CidA/LrgA family holin-like protein [Ornithinibacillus halotolerans]GGA79091.1 membrane protein [Ornithinibacillus halotolerans]
MIRILVVIIHIAFLYIIFRIGTWIQEALHLFVPGSVIGLLLLFLLLLTGIVKVNWIKEGTEQLIKHLPLVFIPVTVGIMDYFSLFHGKGILLVIIVLLSTILVKLSSGFTSQYLMKGREREHE